MPKPSVNFAFIDSQNLNLGIRSQGWRLDYRKFRLYLANKYSVREAFLFIGYLKQNEALYKSLRSAGFTLIFKPAVVLIDGTIKGNVDAELVLHAAAIQYKHYDKAIIVSGDGDFMCLVEFLAERNKLLRVLVPNDKYSSLLRQFDRYIKRLDHTRLRLEHTSNANKKTRTSGRSKP